MYGLGSNARVSRRRATLAPAPDGGNAQTQKRARIARPSSSRHDVRTFALRHGDGARAAQLLRRPAARMARSDCST
jgi:hypothetical protein